MAGIRKENTAENTYGYEREKKHCHEKGEDHKHTPQHEHEEHSGHGHGQGHDGQHKHDHNGHHTHSHTHDPAEIKKIVNSLSRTIGHLESTKKMLMDGQDCADVLIQLAAIKGEVNNAGKALLKEHLEHCIVEAVAEDDKEAVDKMNKAIDMFMK